MAQKKNSKKKNTTLFTAACVLLGLLVILIVFLVKKDQIFTNLKETNFFDKVFGSTPTVIENHEPAEEEPGKRRRRKKPEREGSCRRSNVNSVNKKRVKQ